MNVFRTIITTFVAAKDEDPRRPSDEPVVSVKGRKYFVTKFVANK